MNKLQFQAEDSFNIQIVENKIEKKENIKSNRHKLKGRKKESKNKKKNPKSLFIELSQTRN